jgi:hypothetical protein
MVSIRDIRVRSFFPAVPHATKENDSLLTWCWVKKEFERFLWFRSMKP